MEIKLTEGDKVESNKQYDNLFNKHINKSTIIEPTPTFQKKINCCEEYRRFVAKLDNGKEINTNWLKRV